ncbi:unnamed protein product [Brassica rapa subsp. narinosa]
MEESSTSIIPGLTDDVAALCLSRIPRSNFRVLSQVCRRWKTFLRSEHFAAVRKLTGTMEEFMCVFMKSIRGRKVYWEVFDSSGNNLGQIPPFPGPLKRGFCVAVIGGEKILFIGGYTGMKYWDFSRIPPIASGDINEFSLSTKRNPPLASADVYEFNPATNSWRKLADMNIPRYDFSLAEVDGLLYVVQGFSNDGYCLFNTEVYNPQTNQWSLMDGPVAFPIGGFAFSFKSKLYAVVSHQPNSKLRYQAMRKNLNKIEEEHEFQIIHEFIWLFLHAFMRWWMRRKKTTPFVKKMRGGPTGSSKRQKLQALDSIFKFLQVRLDMNCHISPSFGTNIKKLSYIRPIPTKISDSQTRSCVLSHEVHHVLFFCIRKIPGSLILSKLRITHTIKTIHLIPPPEP